MENMEIEPGSLTEAVFLALASGGEMGEFQNIVKKMWRDGQSEELHKKMRGELADVLIYFDHFMNAFQLSASAIIMEKVQELTERWPHMFEDFTPTKAN
jgi:NTP pyrophosphatase (non-canonical NTP hydrolase)